MSADAKKTAETWLWLSTAVPVLKMPTVWRLHLRGPLPQPREINHCSELKRFRNIRTLSANGDALWIFVRHFVRTLFQPNPADHDRSVNTVRYSGYWQTLREPVYGTEALESNGWPLKFPNRSHSRGPLRTRGPGARVQRASR